MFILKIFITERLLSHDFTQSKLATQSTLKTFPIALTLRIDGSHTLYWSRKHNHPQVARETSTTHTLRLKGRFFLSGAEWFGHFQMSILLVQSKVLPQVPEGAWSYHSSCLTPVLPWLPLWLNMSLPRTNHAKGMWSPGYLIQRSPLETALDANNVSCVHKYVFRTISRNVHCL